MTSFDQAKKVWPFSSPCGKKKGGNKSGMGGGGVGVGGILW